MSNEPERYDTGIRVAEIDRERPPSIETPWGPFALFALDDDVYAVQSFCPHLEGPLFQGTVSGDSITCPWHQWRFSLRTGERLGGFLPTPASDDLVICDVTLSSHGTVILSNPHRVADAPRVE